jgi:tetratricopeptide (TPR) repeat protein
MNIVFLGNCQLEVLSDIFRRFIGRSENVTFYFVNTHDGVTADSYAPLQRADCVVLQHGQRQHIIGRRDIPSDAPVHLVPLVSGAFLWPYQGGEHPLGPAERYGNPPYPPDYNDSFLADLIRKRLPPGEALKIYKAHDVASATHVQRLYVHMLRVQKLLDAACGFDTAGIIERHLRDEQLFQAPYHFSGRIARHLASTLCRRMGFAEIYAQRIQAHLADAPFLERFLPIHPSIARHFGLRWVTEETRYPFLFEGGYTFDEYVLRFMTGTWSAALQEGVIDAGCNAPQARQKLMAGLREAPRSARGHHELAGLLEREGDFAAALAHQRQAFALGRDPAIAHRLGVFLQRDGDLPGAIDAYSAATRLDFVNPAAWCSLRDALRLAGRDEEATRAAAKVGEFSARPLAWDGRKIGAWAYTPKPQSPRHFPTLVRR